MVLECNRDPARETESAGAPIYLQIVNQVKYLAASGRLAPGEEIPSIRALAEQLVINPNTVARAYLELARADALLTEARLLGGEFEEVLELQHARHEKMNPANA